MLKLKINFTDLKLKGYLGHAPSGDMRGESISSLFQLLVAATFLNCDHIIPISASVATLPPLLYASLMMTHIIEFKTHLENP